MSKEKLSEEELTKARLVRQLDLVDINRLDQEINIIGCGGIGSWTTLMLAKMGFTNITIHDFDKVEEHNVASQFFTPTDLEKYKVLALKRNVFEQTGVKVASEIDKRKQAEITEGIIIIAVDSMEERHRLNDMLFDNCDPTNTLIIDGRMSGLQLEVHSCYLQDYHLTLETPGEVVHEPCTGRAISFNCGIIAGVIANRVRAYVNSPEIDELPPTEFRMMFNGYEVSTITNNDLSTEFTKKYVELETGQQ